MKKKSFAIIGLGRFGSAVALTLLESGYEVLALDSNEELVQKYSDKFTHVIAADTTDENALKSLGMRNFDVVIVAIGHDVQASLLTTLLLKEIGVEHIVAKADNLLHGKMLEKIGATRVVYPERDMGQRLAHNLISTNVLEYIELSPNFGIIEAAVPTSLVGLTLQKSDLRAKFGINVVALKRKGQIIVSPMPTEVFEQGDILVIIGDSLGIQQFEKMRT